MRAREQRLSLRRWARARCAWLTISGTGWPGSGSSLARPVVRCKGRLACAATPSGTRAPRVRRSSAAAHRIRGHGPGAHRESDRRAGPPRERLLSDSRIISSSERSRFRLMLGGARVRCGEQQCGLETELPSGEFRVIAGNICTSPARQVIQPHAICLILIAGLPCTRVSVVDNACSCPKSDRLRCKLCLGIAARLRL